MKYNFKNNFDRQEASKYKPGTKVELKQRPGVVDIIAEYDPMMVPPIWLINDPKPRYPEELELIAKPVMKLSWWKPAVHRQVRSYASGAHHAHMTLKMSRNSA